MSGIGDGRTGEARLEALRAEAAAAHPARMAGGREGRPGYYGHPVLKPPPWTWEVPIYLFAGGVAGCSAVLALSARLGGAPESTITTALTIAVAGVVASAALLVSDFVRPGRFHHMLRVLKWRSPMSVGVWLLTAFGASATAALLLARTTGAGNGAAPPAWIGALAWATFVIAALLGALVATYTGVLLSATVVPAWNTHAGVLPVHFGTAALGSSAALLELLGHRLEALHVIGVLAAAVETAVWIWTEVRTHGARDRAVRAGPSGVLVRGSAALSGPLSLLLRVTGFRSVAAAAFLAGALVSRFGWLEAGKESTTDPEASL